MQFHNALYGDGKGWARRFFSDVSAHIPGIMNPPAQVVQRWNKFFVISCLVAVLIDPLFFFLLSVQKIQTTIISFSVCTQLLPFTYPSLNAGQYVYNFKQAHDNNNRCFPKCDGLHIPIAHSSSV